MLALAVVAYFYIGHAEQTGGIFRLPVIIAWVYDLLGKWGIVGLLAVFGVLGLAGGAYELRKPPAAAASGDLPADGTQWPPAT